VGGGEPLVRFKDAPEEMDTLVSVVHPGRTREPGFDRCEREGQLRLGLLSCEDFGAADILVDAFVKGIELLGDLSRPSLFD